MHHPHREATQARNLHRLTTSAEPGKVEPVFPGKSWLATKFSFCPTVRAERRLAGPESKGTLPGRFDIDCWRKLRSARTGFPA